MLFPAVMPTAVAAQTQPENYYWRHAAARRLTHVLPTDINRDGVAEFLIAAENGKLDLISANNGLLQWSYLAGDTIQALTTLQTEADPTTPQYVALVIGNELVLLDNQSNEQWRQPLTAVLPPEPLLRQATDTDIIRWHAQHPLHVSQITPYDANNDGRDELLILLHDGQLLLYNTDGRLLWRRTQNTSPGISSQPVLQTADLNQDGRHEIILGYFNPHRRFSQVFLLNGDGQDIWPDPLPLSGHISAIALVPFADNSDLSIAMATDRGQIHLYNYYRQRQWWLRTLNTPITALSSAILPEGPALLAGTDVGLLVAYNRDGRRLWERRLTAESGRPVLSLSTASFPTNANQPVLAVTIGPPNGISGNVHLQLRDSSGFLLDEFVDGDTTTTLSQLLDINSDEHSELLFARFATIELLGMGIGASETAREWDYSLNAEPGSLLTVDFNNDGIDEILIGTQDGHLHYLSERNKLGWLVVPGGAITHLALLPEANTTTPQAIVLVRNQPITDENGRTTTQGWVEVRQSNGDWVWEQPITAEITSLLVADINQRGRAEIIVGDANGMITAFTADGARLWEKSLIPNNDTPPQPIQILLPLQSPDGSTRIIAASSQYLYAAHIRDLFDPPTIAHYPQESIHNIFLLNQPGVHLATRLLVLENALARGLNWSGIQLHNWPVTLGGPVNQSIPANDIIEEAYDENILEAFLLATTDNEVLRLSVKDNSPTIQWSLSGIGDVSTLYWGDLDGNRLPEFAIGDHSGKIRLYTTQSTPKYMDELLLNSGVFALSAIRQPAEQRADLLAVTENGEVQLFRAQENRPPLLTDPKTAVATGQYGFNINITDVEEDQVTVQLDIYNPETRTWEAHGQNSLPNGNGSLFWPVLDPPTTPQGVRYRFQYDDGNYTGYIYPPNGPIPILPTSVWRSQWAIGAALLLVTGFISFLFVRQVQSPSARIRRFYRRLKHDPQQTLIMLENRYASSAGSPDFLLGLSRLARQRHDDLISTLADGLFLLADRPHVSLPILLSALKESQRKTEQWNGLERWLMVYRTGLNLIDAATFTELSLFHPQLAAMLQTLDAQNRWSPPLNALLPILTHIRDSERVELTEDRLVYLNEAAHLLAAFHQNVPEFSPRIERTMAMAITRRWYGLVKTEIEELRGRAELVVQLKTKRLVPSQQIQVTFSLHNNGRAPAENIIAELHEDPGYHSITLPQEIPLLPPGRTRQISFAIAPHVTDRFRIGLTVTFDDRNQANRTVIYGDRVEMLPPVRDFKPIENPYRPGTPLRQNSTVFYGRKRLFKFIADNAGGQSQRNVLILIGQRRTGKTSALLNLQQHLPDHLLPVYIDCQSLGVIPGMPALFHDWAWVIADTLSLHDIELEVPELATWEQDPTGQFQRHFLPNIRSLLPQNTTLLLIFDEFEAFESLVEDNILPSNFFNFLRHLMQHSDGLSFIFVGTRRLEEMSADYWSVLFNIALYERIGYLNETAATQLITEPVAPHLVYDDLAIDKILRVTDGHPYFLQLVCYTLVKRANQERTGYVTISDVNAALDEMISLGEVHFAYIWQRSSYTEKVLLTAVAHMMERDRALHPQDFVDFLEPYGLQLNPAEVTAALNTLVEREIMGEVHEGTVTLYELRIGLVGLWTAKHKSLSKLHATPAIEQETKGAAPTAVTR
jgi:hypothetical protein